MKRLHLVMGIVGAGALVGAACAGSQPQLPSASATPSTSASPLQAGSTLVDCGYGQRAVLAQANGVTHVQCVPAYASSGSLTSVGNDHVLPVPIQAQAPAVVYDAPAQARPAVYEPRPTVRPAARRVVTRGRTWKKSAAIIGGSTAAGAGVGAIMSGGDGAKKGAVVGLLGGVVYDIATRDR